MSRTKILVLTNSKDGVHTDTVLSKLSVRGQGVFRFDAEKEMRIFLEGLWNSMRGAFWLSNPHDLERARKKILQLRIAQELGFRVPRTLITNNPSAARDFIQGCAGSVVFKVVHHEFLNYGDRQYNIPTTLLGPRHLEQLELIKRLPGLFQEFIPKAYELRVTVVGDKVFTVRIDSQDNPATIVDWRHPEIIPQLHHSVVELPATTSSLCQLMLQKLGLAFGAFDFAVDKEGSLYFLEVNPNGQWYWLEHFTGVAIADAIADLLTSVCERRT